MEVSEIIALFEQNGGSQYGGEAVSQLEHALQCAALAESEHAAPALVAAALLHDIGHLLHDLPEEAPDSGIDDFHEVAGREFLQQLFPEDVTAPVALHVAAKRYLCTTDADYLAKLSRPSVCSLKLQGGLMSADEVADFESQRFGREAIRLRQWDDLAKVTGLKVPPLQHYSGILSAVARKESTNESAV